MGSTEEPDGINLILMGSPTTKRLLLVLPSNVVGSAETASVTSFANQLGDQLAVISKLLEVSDRHPIPENYVHRRPWNGKTLLKAQGRTIKRRLSNRRSEPRTPAASLEFVSKTKL